MAPIMIPRGFLEPTLDFAMWTPTTRQQHSRPVTRYQTDLTDAEWRVIALHLPKPCAKGRPREWPMCEIVNGIFYVMRAGCPWRLLPTDLPPWGTSYRWFAAWRDDGRFERINHAPVMADRERVGRDASPSAALSRLAVASLSALQRYVCNWGLSGLEIDRLIRSLLMWWTVPAPGNEVP